MIDNYYWLREKSNPEVRAYLEKENAYTDAVMKPTEPLQKKLYDEMLSRVKETDVEVPYKEGDYFYYVRTEAGKQYQIRCRKKASMDAPEEVLLDINQMAQGKPFMTVQAFAVSPDGNLLAYSYDDTGFRQFTLAVKDLRTGTDSHRSRRARRLSRAGPVTIRRSSTRRKMTFPNASTGSIAILSGRPTRTSSSTRNRTSASTLKPTRLAASLIFSWSRAVIQRAKPASFLPLSRTATGRLSSLASKASNIIPTTTVARSTFASTILDATSAW